MTYSSAILKVSPLLLLLKNSFQYVLQGVCNGGELRQLLFVWENLYFSFVSVG